MEKNSKLRFLSGLVLGFLLSAGLISFRYIRLLPSGTLFLSRKDLICELTQCNEPRRSAMEARMLVGDASQSQKNNPLRPEFQNPDFWKGFQLAKRAEIEALAQERIHLRDSIYKDVSRDWLIIELLSRSMDQNIWKGDAEVGKKVRSEGLDKVLSLAEDFAKTQSGH